MQPPPSCSARLCRIRKEMLPIKRAKSRPHSGYQQSPADSYVSFTSGAPARDYWKSHDHKGKSWDDPLAAEPIYDYFYRESPESLIAKPLGEVGSTNPAPGNAGMLSMTLNFGGRLRNFEAIATEKPQGTPERRSTKRRSSMQSASISRHSTKQRQSGLRWLPTIFAKPGRVRRPDCRTLRCGSKWQVWRAGSRL